MRHHCTGTQAPTAAEALEKFKSALEDQHGEEMTRKQVKRTLEELLAIEKDFDELQARTGTLYDPLTYIHAYTSRQGSSWHCYSLVSLHKTLTSMEASLSGHLPLFKDKVKEVCSPVHKNQKTETMPYALLPAILFIDKCFWKSAYLTLLQSVCCRMSHSSGSPRKNLEDKDILLLLAREVWLAIGKCLIQMQEQRIANSEHRRLTLQIWRVIILACKEIFML